MTRRLALPAILAIAALAGCVPTTASPDLSSVLTTDDAPPGMTWVASGAELTAGNDLESIHHEWEHSAGEPESCLPMYLVPYGLASSDTDSSDRTVEIGYFTLERYEGSILVNAREFPTEQAAIDYVQHALEAANDCAGYRIGEHAVAPDGFAVARFTGGHGLVIDGGSVDDGVTSRTVVVRADRTILVVDAFLFDAIDLDVEILDELARTVLERLDATT